MSRLSVQFSSQIREEYLNYVTSAFDQKSHYNEYMTDWPRRLWHSEKVFQRFLESNWQLARELNIGVH